MNKLYTTKEADELLGLTTGSVGVYIRRGVLIATKYGRDWMVSHDELMRYNQEYRGRLGAVVVLREIPNVADDAQLRIPLSNGDTTIVSGIDRDLYAHKWQTSNGYASRPIKRKSHTMHRIIMERMIDRPLEKSEYVDHIDRNILNNQRSNLRVASPSQNLVNSKVSKRSKTKLKGVQFKPNLGKWRARIADEYLGYFDNPNDAARAYNEAAIRLFGEFAQLNTVSE